MSPPEIGGLRGFRPLAYGVRVITPHATTTRIALSQVVNPSGRSRTRHAAPGPVVPLFASGWRQNVGAISSSSLAWALARQNSVSSRSNWF